MIPHAKDSQTPTDWPITYRDTKNLVHTILHLITLQYIILNLIKLYYTTLQLTRVHCTTEICTPQHEWWMFCNGKFDLQRDMEKLSLYPRSITCRRVVDLNLSLMHCYLGTKLTWMESFIPLKLYSEEGRFTVPVWIWWQNEKYWPGPKSNPSHSAIPKMW
jgi:hypothetical protein